jgi:hypothetical protein
MARARAQQRRALKDGEGSPFVKTVEADDAAPAVNGSGAYAVSGPASQQTGPP